MTDAPVYDVELTRTFDAPAERVFEAFTDAGAFVSWYGPPGFPVHRDTVRIDPRVGGEHRFTMVAETDPAVRASYDGRFTEVVPGRLLASSGAWDGIPGVSGSWSSNLRVELTGSAGSTDVLLLEGPHPPGSADLGRQAWVAMFTALEAALTRP